jgi:excisionase family DNA binding protein
MGTLLTVEEAAEVLRLKRGTVYNLVATRKIRHSRVGCGHGRIVIPADAIEEYLSQTTVGVEEGTKEPLPPPPPKKTLPAFKHIRVS